jgi:hypothetical protein
LRTKGREVELFVPLTPEISWYVALSYAGQMFFIILFIHFADVKALLTHEVYL